MAKSEFQCVYEVIEDRKAELLEELREDSIVEMGPLILSRSEAREVVWSHNVWTNLQQLMIASVADGAKQLRGLGRKWHRVYAAPEQHRRSILIEEALPRWQRPRLEFPVAPAPADWGSWALVGRDEILCGTKNSSPFLQGVPNFLDPSFEMPPPSQAYRKLWEIFCLLGRWPKADEVCLDLGSAPGGWTWTLLNLGAEVWSVDRGEMDPNLQDFSKYHQFMRDAFRIQRQDLARTPQWIFSDVICYPERLKEFLAVWKDIQPKPNFIFTLKFQGPTDFAILREFQSYPGSFTRHLHANKHEVTWAWLRAD